VQHEVPVNVDFKPKRLKAYRVPENLKTEVDLQISELLKRGVIKRSSSAMASPIVVVLKRDGGVRIAVNYQYVNSHTVPDVTPLTSISEVIQQVGRAKKISVFDATAGYHQCPVKPEHQWLTGFVCESDLDEFFHTSPIWNAVEWKYVCTGPALRVPETKKQVKQIIGFFTHYREYMRNFADIAKPITDLTSNRVSKRIT